MASERNDNLFPEMGADAVHRHGWSRPNCGCGCGEPIAGKSTFRQGHDARLKGILIRAAAAGLPLVAVKDGRRVWEISPSDRAVELGWGEIVARGLHKIRARAEARAEREARSAQRAAERAAKAPKAPKAPKSKTATLVDLEALRTTKQHLADWGILGDLPWADLVGLDRDGALSFLLSDVGFIPTEVTLMWRSGLREADVTSNDDGTLTVSFDTPSGRQVDRKVAASKCKTLTF